MSLENALEEERLSVVKLLESVEKKPHTRHVHSSSPGPRSSLLVNDKPASGRSSFSAASSGSRRPSMLLDFDTPPASKPKGSMLLSDNTKQSNSRPGNARATSSSNVRSNGNSDHELKPTKSSPAYTQRSNFETKKHIDPSESLRPTLSSSSRDNSRSQTSRFNFWKSDEPTQNLTGSRSSPSSSRPRAEGRSHSHSNILSPTKSTESTSYSKLSPQSSRSRSSSRPRKDDMNFNTAFRLLTTNQLKKADGALGELYRAPSADNQRLENDDESTSDEDEESGSSSDDTDSEEDSADDDSDSDLDGLNTKIMRPARTTKSLMAAMEEERKSVETSKFRVKSLLDVPLPPGTVPPPSMAEYAAYKRRIIHPNTAFDDILEDAPYTSDTEEIMDARRAAEIPFNISTVHSTPGSKRMIRTMTRGESTAAITDPNAPRPKTFVLGTDLSPEAAHALEWTVGTVLRDSNVLYVVCAYEDELVSGSSSTTVQQQEEERMDAMSTLTNIIVKLLKKTRLQVHVIIEVIHCKSPKHLLTAVIDHVNPTMVVLGSRGRSALKGVLLGSFSNYIVERSSVPVMVARRKLQKTKHKDLNPRLANNLRGQGLSMAKVD